MEMHHICILSLINNIYTYIFIYSCKSLMETRHVKYLNRDKGENHFSSTESSQSPMFLCPILKEGQWLQGLLPFALSYVKSTQQLFTFMTLNACINRSCWDADRSFNGYFLFYSPIWLLPLQVFELASIHSSDWRFQTTIDFRLWKKHFLQSVDLNKANHMFKINYVIIIITLHNVSCGVVVIQWFWYTPIGLIHHTL